ncbi:hypothetical protein [Salinibacter ruber]|uniref:DNA-directed RNA polymerase specialized sigma subunit n=1 Tax=Salinibacter ruber TaxID=146919 RepID=A0AAW5P6I1_9BACT|nr:hypothetical protein [Salinibacter ruber]MCS4157646.1 DNA-directed RNA polymerase specialized sigma subunit [Salinibacter ruber]
MDALDENDLFDGDDGADFFRDTPVRKEVFENYDGDADATEVLQNSDLSYEGEMNVLKDKGARPSSANPERYGLPSFEMEEDAPEDVDSEMWEAAKNLPDDQQHNLWRAWKFGTKETERGDPRMRGRVFQTVKNMTMDAVHKIEDEAVTKPAVITNRRGEALKAIDNYDPREGNAKLSTHVGNYVYQGLGEVVRMFGDANTPGSGDIGDNLGKIKDYIDEVKEQKNRRPTRAEFAEQFSVSKDKAGKALMGVADEYDMEQTIDEEDLVPDRLADKKEAIHLVYADASNRRQVLMEHMFPGILDGAPKNPIGMNKGLIDTVADKTGVSSSTISRDKDKIIEEIDRIS